MKLPNHEKALVEERKITAYLLSDENSGGKSMFFAAFGFTIDAWKMLRDSLLEHVAAYEVTRTLKSPYGFKYIIEGAVPTPDGRSPKVRSVWIIDADKDIPRLVTAYPLEGEDV